MILVECLLNLLTSLFLLLNNAYFKLSELLIKYWSHLLSSSFNFRSMLSSYWTIHVIALKYTLIQLTSPHIPFNYAKHLSGVHESRLAVVTGGSSGIGLETVIILYRAHMHVIVGCLNAAESRKVLSRRMRGIVSYGHVQVVELDLASFESVRSFANYIFSASSRLHLLINNGGIMFSEYELTVDLFERQYEVNFLSHFYLTSLLLPLLTNGSTTKRPSRIINVSSVAHYGAQPHSSALFNFFVTNRYQAYMDSKFCQVALSTYLGRKLIEEGIVFNSAHPGIIITPLYQNVLYASLLQPLLKLLYKSPVEGGENICSLALDDDKIEGGKFYIDGRESEPHGATRDFNYLKRAFSKYVEDCGLTDFGTRRSPRSHTSVNSVKTRQIKKINNTQKMNKIRREKL